MVSAITPASRMAYMAKPLNIVQSRAEEQFKKIQKLDKKILLEKERTKQEDREKTARLKALRLAKEASESA